MSHLIEEYAKNLGVKIGKPVICEHFFPIIAEKYITVCLEGEQESKKYKYFNIALDAIKTLLQKHSIKIVQIGSSKSEKLTSSDDVFFDLDFKKTAYIVKNGLLHVGVDNAIMHYASSINKPIVTLFGNTYASSCDGYWSHPKSKINIEAPWSIRPSFNAVDPEDSINKILPEQVAEAILKHFGLTQPIGLVSHFFGEFYHSHVFELVPDFFERMPDMLDKHWFIRLDYTDSYSYLESWADYLDSFSFFTTKIIPHQFILKIKNKLKMVNFLVDEDSVIPTNYLDFLSGVGIKAVLLVKDESILAKVRDKYFDYPVHLYVTSDSSILKDKNITFGSSRFHSSKTIVSRGKKYPSTYHWKKDENILDKNFVLVDNQELLKELNNFYIYDTKQN